MKNIKTYILALAFVLFAVSLHAQQDPNFTMYRYNMNIINPAYAGSNGTYDLNLMFRKQWTGIDDAPVTSGLSFAAPIGDKVGLGISVVHDDVFVLQETDVVADFSYRVQLGDEHNMFLGLKAGANIINLDLLALGLPGDPLLAQNENKVNPTVGAGVLFKGNKYYVSVSTTNFLNGKRFERKAAAVQSGKDRLHLYTTGGYTFDISDNVSLTPGVFARFVSGAPTTTEVFTIADFHQKVEAGVAFRPDESISFSALFKLVTGFDFGYAYEHTTTDVESVSDGTHEFIVRISFE